MLGHTPIPGFPGISNNLFVSAEVLKATIIVMYYRVQSPQLPGIWRSSRITKHHHVVYGEGIRDTDDFPDFLSRLWNIITEDPHILESSAGSAGYLRRFSDRLPAKSQSSLPDIYSEPINTPGFNLLIKRGWQSKLAEAVSLENPAYDANRHTGREFHLVESGRFHLSEQDTSPTIGWFEINFRPFPGSCGCFQQPLSYKIL